MMKRKVYVLYFKHLSFNKVFNKGSTLFLFINHHSTFQQLNKQSKMNISDNMAITEFLQEHGHQPTSVKRNNWWYLSPLRNEFTASFKVDGKRFRDASRYTSKKYRSSFYSWAIFFCFHLSGSNSRYLLIGVLGGSVAALLITSDIYSKKLTPCSLQEHASE